MGRAWRALQAALAKGRMARAGELPPPLRGPFPQLERLRVHTAFFGGETWLKQMERADWQNTDPRIALFAALLVRELRKANVPMFVHSAFRSPTQQIELVARGVSRAKPPRAPHVQGAAVDIVHSRFAWELSKAEWDMIGRIGKRIAERADIPVQWGGDWDFWDPAHWELADWRDHIRLDVVAGEPVRRNPVVIRDPLR